MELTKQQIKRQDYVDNAIYALINDLIPSDLEMEWNIETIGEVRDAIQSQLVQKGFCTEQEFYPYIEERNLIDSELHTCTIEKDMQNKDSLLEIADKLREFNHIRDWEQFHDAKNLALSISIEASELNECFLWKKADEADINKVKEELADVFLCAIMLADKYGIDIRDICLRKIERNAQKYPVEKAKGKATKYDEL